MSKSINYKYLLFDKRWKAKREVILERDQNECIFCGSKDHLHVHHKQYHFSESLQKFVDPWDYKDKYFITVCNTCHDKGHALYSIPTKKIK